MSNVNDDHFIICRTDVIKLISNKNALAVFMFYACWHNRVPVIPENLKDTLGLNQQEYQDALTYIHDVGVE